MKRLVPIKFKFIALEGENKIYADTKKIKTPSTEILPPKTRVPQEILAKKGRDVWGFSSSHLIS